MCRLTRVVVLLLFCLIVLNPIHATESKVGVPQIDFFSRNEYGGTNQNWKIANNQYDLLFVANNEGLLCYDGTRWTKYPQNEKFIVRCLCRQENRIYVGGYNELGYFDYNKESKLVYTSLASNPALKTLGDYWNVLLFDNRVFYYSESAICVFKNDSLEKIIPSNSRFYGFYKVKDRLFIHDNAKGLLEYKNGNLIYLKDGEQFAHTALGSIMPFKNNQFIIGTLNQGLFIGNNNSIRAWDVPVNPLLKKANIFCGSLYLDDYLMFGSIQMGLIIVNKQGELVSQIGSDKGLHNNSVLSIHVDKESVIWCGLDNGIAKVNLNSSLSFLQSYYKIGTGYALDYFQDSYYLATNQSVYKIDKKAFANPLKVPADFKRVEGTEGQSWSLYSDSESLLCAHVFGVFQINGTTSRRITPASVNGVWCFKKIKDHPNLLLAGCYDGLIILEKINHQWQYRNKIEGFSELSRMVEWDDANTLFISHTEKSIFKIVLNQDYTKVLSSNIIPFTNFPNNKSSLTLSKIDNQNIFVNSNGFFTLDINNIPQRYTRFDGYFENNNFPLSINQDRSGNIWCFYKEYIGLLQKNNDGTYTNILSPFEVLHNKMNDVFQSSFQVDELNTFLNIEEGFVQYTHKKSADTEVDFKVHLTSLKSVNDTVFYCQFQDKNAPEQSFEPHFAYQNNTIEANFSTPYSSDNGMKYSTFLKGYDKAPTPLSTASSRTFINLKEGEYQFSVFAQSRYQTKTAPLVYRFIVNPPWYRSLPVKLLYLAFTLFAIGFGYWGFKKYINNLKKRILLRQQKEFKLKEEQFLKEALLNEKELIKLKNEQLSAEMFYKEKELSSLAVHVIQKNDFLSELMENLTRISSITEPLDLNRKLIKLIQKIGHEIENENNWSEFERQFELVHATFLSQLRNKHPKLSMRDQKLCAYVKMGMSSREIGSLLGISTPAVDNNRSRLRQALGLKPDVVLAEYILTIN